MLETTALHLGYLNLRNEVYRVTLDQLVSAGVDRIYREDLSTQVNYIDYIMNNVRHMPPDIIYTAQGFFVPNDSYLGLYFGKEAYDIKFGLYNSFGECIWLGCLVFPIKDLAGTIVGLASFNPQKYLEARETQNWLLNYYSYSTKNVFTKGNYLFMIEGTFMRALESGYLILTDGLFDCLSLAACGYHAAALMGSSVTVEILAQLRFIKKVIIISDNDEAGLLLEKKLGASLKQLLCIHQDRTKDIDELLKTEYRQEFLSRLDSIIASTVISNQNIRFK